MSLEPIREYGNITPLERIPAAEARKLVAACIERGLIKPPSNGIDSAEAARRYEVRMAMRRMRGKVAECNAGEAHQPNENGRCIRCGRKVNSIHELRKSD